MRSTNAAQYLTVLPALINATCLALLDAGVPMRCIFGSTLIVVDRENSLNTQPGSKSFEDAQSLHVLAFSSKGELLLAESEGAFSLAQWTEVEKKAKVICLDSDAGSAMIIDSSAAQSVGLVESVRQMVQNKAQSDNRWRDG